MSYSTYNGCIKRNSDGAWIPSNELNSDYQKYLLWTSLGNIATVIPYIPYNPSDNQTFTTKTYVDTALNTKLNISSNSLSTDEKTETSINTYSNPLVHKYHKCSAKAYFNINSNGTINGSYGITSISKTGTGTYLVTFQTPFADTNYSYSITGDLGSLLITFGSKSGTQTTSTIVIQVVNTLGLLDAPGKISAVFFGSI